MTADVLIAASPESVFRNVAFRRLFAAAAASQVGTQVSFIAIPFVAESALRASPGQIGLLGVFSTLAFLVIGLPAGAWVDRLRRRRVMVAADLLRGLLLGSVPVAWWAGALTINQLYLVVLLAGVATVFFDVASLSYLPSIVGRDRLVDANGALVSIGAGSDVAGRAAGGFLVSLLTAPVAIVVDAFSYLWSAIMIGRIGGREPAPARGDGRHLGQEVREGLSFVFRHPILRPIALQGALTNLSIQLSVTMLPVLYARELKVGEWVLGLFLATGGVGIFLGAFTARRQGKRLGQGRSLWITGMAVAPFAFLLPFADRGIWLWLAGAAWVLTTFRIGVNNVVLVSFRQQVTPDRLLGRMNATMRFLFTGALAVGAALAGLLAEIAGVRAALWAGAIGLALTWVPLFFSALRSTRELPNGAVG